MVKRCRARRSSGLTGTLEVLGRGLHGRILVGYGLCLTKGLLLGQALFRLLVKAHTLRLLANSTLAR